MSPQDAGEKRAESGRCGKGADREPAREREAQGGRQLPAALGAPDTHLVQGGIGDVLRREVATLGALGCQQRKEAQDSQGPGQRHAYRERHWNQAGLMAGGYSDLYIQLWVESWSPLVTRQVMLAKRLAQTVPSFPQSRLWLKPPSLGLIESPDLEAVLGAQRPPIQSQGRCGPERCCQTQ